MVCIILFLYKFKKDRIFNRHVYSWCGHDNNKPTPFAKRTPESVSRKQGNRETKQRNKETGKKFWNTAAAAASTTGAPASTTGAAGSTTGAPASTTAAPPASSTTEGSPFRAECILQLTTDSHNDPTEACDAIILLNTYRANHNADPFVIPSAALCAGAQAWADSEAANNENGLPGSTPSMMHSAGDDRPGEGENIAWSSAGTLTLSEATTMWQSEDAYWDFTNHKDCMTAVGTTTCPSCIHGPNPGGFDCGRFAQNVWKATTSVCVAKAVNGAGTFVVARYEPGGTWWKSGIYMNSMTTQIDGGGPLDGNYVGTVHVPST